MVELDFMCYQDGSECGVLEDLLNRFSEENPGITVAVNVVPYTTVRDQLRVQVEAGQAPDMARITDFAGMAGFYLDVRPLMEDPSLFEDNFNPRHRRRLPQQDPMMTGSMASPTN